VQKIVDSAGNIVEEKNHQLKGKISLIPKIYK